MHRAERRRRLLELGVSLSEQAAWSTRELDELLAVAEVRARHANDQMKEVSRG